jgi:hypothetical protein
MDVACHHPVSRSPFAAEPLSQFIGMKTWHNGTQATRKPYYFKPNRKKSNAETRASHNLEISVEEMREGSGRQWEKTEQTRHSPFENILRHKSHPKSRKRGWNSTVSLSAGSSNMHSNGQPYTSTSYFQSIERGSPGGSPTFHASVDSKGIKTEAADILGI